MSAQLNVTPQPPQESFLEGYRQVEQRHSPVCQEIQSSDLSLHAGNSEANFPTVRAFGGAGIGRPRKLQRRRRQLADPHGEYDALRRG